MFSSVVPQVVVVVLASLTLCPWAEAFVAGHYLPRQPQPAMSALTELGHSTPIGRDAVADALPLQAARTASAVQGLGEVVSQYDSFLIGEFPVRVNHHSSVCLPRFDQLECLPRSYEKVVAVAVHLQSQ